MDQSPVTDKSIGIGHTSKHRDTFAEVRTKSKRDYEDRHVKSKRNKESPVPKFAIGEEIVVSQGYQIRDYVLMEIIDFEEHSRSFYYYGIVKKVTSRNMMDRIGRLIRTEGIFGWVPANVSPEGIRWIDG